MSIIHEALKKVQLSLRNRPGAPDAAAATIVGSMAPETSAPAAAPKSFNWPVILISLVVLGIGGYLVYQQSSKIPEVRSFIAKVNPIPQRPLGPLAKIPAKTSAAATANTNKQTHDEFSVQGIMSKNGSTVALINGKIYAKGDSIDGIKITNINEEAITLLRDGQEEKIRVRH